MSGQKHSDTSKGPFRRLKLTLRAEPESSAFVHYLIQRLYAERVDRPIPHIAWLRDRIELHVEFPDDWTCEVKRRVAALVAAGLVMEDHGGLLGEFVALHAASDDLGRALLSTGPGKGIVRVLRWLTRKAGS